MSINREEDRDSNNNYASFNRNQDNQEQKDENKFTFKGKLISIKIKL